MSTNALMNNSGFLFCQQKGNLELSATEGIFPETKKPTGFPSCFPRSLLLLHALLHRPRVWGGRLLDTDWSFGSECPYFRLRQVLCNCAHSNCVVSIWCNGVSHRGTTGVYKTTYSMCVHSYICRYAYKHTYKHTYT